MDGPTIGIAGAVIGSVVGVLGGAIGVFASLKNAQGPRERAFVARASAGFVALVLALLAALFLLPPAYQWLAWLVYLPALLLGIRACNKAQACIRAEEAAAQGDGGADAERHP
jgi:hypothetical protein